MAIYIPDFYHGDKIESWNDLRKATHFVIFKATQGITFVSPKLDEYIENCERYEIPYWLYSFLNRGNELAQAKFLVSTCKKKVGKFFRGYCLDVEMGNTAAGVQAALNWLKTQTAKTMIYTFYADYNRMKPVLDARGAACAWWEARVRKADSGQYDPDLPCHSDADLHQFTWKGSCPGIKNKCDLSRLTGSMPEVFFVGKEVTIPKTAVTAQTIIDIMQGWEGLSRADGSHKVIIDLYNDHKPLARGYKVTLKDNYCATTISAAYIKANAVDLIGGTECSVERMIEDCFKPKGIWNEDGKVTPDPGWVICFNWDGGQPNDGWADHIGIVKNVKDGVITTIEGNYGGEVKERKIKVGDGRIRGYAMPPYATVTFSEPNTATKKKYTGKYPELPERGYFELGDGYKTLVDQKTQIKRVQRLVNWVNGGSREKDAVDGKYGEKTVDAVKAAQKTLGVKADGEFGAKTLAAAKAYRK